MKFSSKVMLCTIVPLAAAGSAAIVGLLGIWAAQQRFERFFEHEQQLADSVREMYAQGLQMGQAARNIVLDPANRKAYDNLEKAAADYGKAVQDADAAAQGDAVVQAALAEIAGLREVQSGKQKTLIELVKVGPKEAIAHLNKEETPAWRALKARLLDLGAEVRSQMQATRAAALAETNNNASVLSGLTIAGMVLALCFTWGMARVLRRDVGGDPAEARQLMQAAAAGDLLREVALRRGDHASLFFFIEQMRRSLQRLIGGVRGSVDSITAALAEIATGNNDLANRTSEQASNLAETSSSMAQMTTTVQHNAENAQRANQLVTEASDVAARGGAVVGQVVTTMQAISAQSQKIAEIVEVIDGIAFQTNILALNAAVEAARAGDHGRGFAVVAEEVRGLAKRSAEAAREINGLIDASVEQVHGGALLVDEAGRTMNEIVTQVRSVTDLVAGITAATVEQSRGIEHVNQAVTQLDQTTQLNAALVEENAAVAASLQDQAQQLAHAVAVFKVGAVSGVPFGQEQPA